MIATFVNCMTVFIGSLLGVLFHRRIGEEFKGAVFTALGVFTLTIGLQMSLEFTRVLYVALSLVVGGILGAWWDLEGRLLALGDILERRFVRGDRREGEGRFAQGFLNASLLFCVGAMSIVGAFKAGMEGNYDLLLTKSVMDGFAAMALASALGIGVTFSVIVILVYQGGLTLLSLWLGNFVSPLTLTEVSAVGGMLILMIGINLLKLREIKTANFLPALVLVALFASAEPLVLALWEGLGF